ncbi:MAG: acyl-CoA thioesterase [Desulfobacteraceae bacterium]|nr:MAG: acyl-CoA thioesterase [Desulfobacteraceae bacterium]
MNEKTVRQSRVIVSQVMLPEDANPAGNVHGGTIMKLIDNAAGVVAVRHSRCNCVTASVDQIDFHHPAFIGDLLMIKASLNLVGKTSMEIGARVESENLLTGETRHIASAYLTFVALDSHSKPLAVPGLIFETDKEKQRNCAAQVRRKNRLEAKNMHETNCSLK